LFTAKINSHATRRINATDGTSYLTLTARAMPYDITDTTTAINEFYMVNFKVTLLSNNYTTATTVVYTTAPFPGNGTWQRVRDAEKRAQSYKGIMNRTVFPVFTPAMRVVKDETYDSIIIEHSKSYSSPDSYNKTTRLTTELFIPNTTSSNQMDDVLAVLNPWMASCPGDFANISF
jgi:hypothetical protein